MYVRRLSKESATMAIPLLGGRVSSWKGRGNIQRHLEGSRVERESSRLDAPGLKKQSGEIVKITLKGPEGEGVGTGH